MAIIKRTRRGRTTYAVRYAYTGGTPREKHFQTLREAKSFEANLRIRRAATNASPGHNTINTIADLWLDTHVSRLEHSTRRGYRRHLNHRILPSLGQIPLGELDTPTLTTWIADLETAGHSKHSISGAMRTLRALTRWAINHGHTTLDPTTTIRITGVPRPARARALSRSEVDAVASCLDLLRDASLIRVGAGTGMRPQELFALQWDDVDLPGRRVTIRRARGEDGIAKALKNHRERVVPLMASVVQVFEVWRPHVPAVIPWVFPNADGGMVGASRWRAHIRKQLRDAGFGDVTLANLRDTFASTMIEAGASPRQLQAWLGHSTIQTTYKHYAAELEGRDDAVMNAADRL